MQVEKSLQRINRGYKNAMYTSQKSIENKVGNVEGWKDLLMSVGFRFEPAANGIPSAVFFPQSDPGERLTQCSASLQAILALSPTSWAALASLLASPESADEVMALFRQVVGELATTTASNSRTDLDTVISAVEVPVSVKLWRVPGCHELLASLGFDLSEVGREEILLRTCKTANRRQIQFALQALVALFDTEEAPRSLNVSDSCDSLYDFDDNEDHEVSSDKNSLSPSPPPPVPIPPFPAPRKSDLVLDGSGAFSSYARNRGEPDGRQAQADSPTSSTVSGYQPKAGGGGGGLVDMGPSLPPPPPQQQLLHSSIYHHQKGRESDCNFTPSPVSSINGMMPRYGVAANSFTINSSHDTPRSNNSSSTYSPGGGSSGLAGGRLTAKVKHGPSPLSRPESCSSSGSMNDWEAGQATTMVRRHQHHPQPSLSKLSPGVTNPASVSGLGLGFRKYLQQQQPTAIYENSELLEMGRGVSNLNNNEGQVVPSVRSVFTEAGGYNLAANSSAAASPSSSTNPNDKLSIRAEMNRSAKVVTRKEAAGGAAADGRLEPGVTTRIPPTGGSNSPRASTLNFPRSSGSTGAAVDSGAAGGVIVRQENLGGEHSIKEHIMSSQMRRINRELPISEVYHERSLGLGLAPPLSKLIMSNNIAVAQVDHHPVPEPEPADSITSFDNPSMVEEARRAAKLGQQSRPQVPPKPETWAGPGYRQRKDEDQRNTDLLSKVKPELSTDLVPSPVASRARDEGDGRSMTDSQYSGYSPSGATTTTGPPSSHRDLASRFNYMKIVDSAVSSSSGGLGRPTAATTATTKPTAAAPPRNTEDAASTVTSVVINPAIRASDVAQYINKEFHSNKTDDKARHPQLWSKDKNGVFTYTGNFASDC